MLGTVCKCFMSIARLVLFHFTDEDKNLSKLGNSRSLWNPGGPASKTPSHSAVLHVQWASLPHLFHSPSQAQGEFMQEAPSSSPLREARTRSVGGSCGSTGWLHGQWNRSRPGEGVTMRTAPLGEPQSTHPLPPSIASSPCPPIPRHPLTLRYQVGGEAQVGHGQHSY